jgi:hypothetical protein
MLNPRRFAHRIITTILDPRVRPGALARRRGKSLSGPAGLDPACIAAKMVDGARYGLIATRAMISYDCNEGHAVVMTVIGANARRAKSAI